MGYSILEVTTGTLKPAVGTQDTGMEQAYRLEFNDGNADLLTLWNSYYEGIEAANIAINSIPKINDPELTEEISENLLAEAHFLRAYYYFQLVQIFGEIPLNLKPTESLSDGQISKTGIKEIYEGVIVPDLLTAESADLPNTSPIGRVSKGTVKSLLAKVYLTMAGYPLNQSDKYTLARDKAKEVIDAGWYSLFQSDAGGLSWMDKLSDPAFDLGSEHILMAQYDGSFVISTISSYYSPLGGAGKVTNMPLHFGGMEPEETFLSSYPSTDVRGQNQGFFFSEMDGHTFNPSVYKFFYEGFKSANGVSNKNVGLIRYADVLLTFSEAQNEADGANAQAYNTLNQIRTRAGLPEISGLSKEQFREEVWKQRVWEFPAENGLIWFDMKRTMKVYNGTGFSDFQGHTLPSGFTLTEDNLYWPVPANDATLNPNL
ncbi:RagB/SusD family nutrient uptake outer membrane protein [Echinicola sediminis]